MDNISSCKSPMGMLSAVIKAHGASSGRRVVTVAVMPCTAKKHEAALSRDTDYVITTLELVAMIRESGLIFGALQPEALIPPSPPVPARGCCSARPAA
jgi:NADH-quinone oxidoreductase subunit G